LLFVQFRLSPMTNTPLSGLPVAEDLTVPVICAEERPHRATPIPTISRGAKSRRPHRIARL